jgi:D-psicose/D-tagatose/L-ribulose 3-epimerase
VTLSVSNIAWTAAQDEAALELLASLGVRHLELAPTRWWPDLSDVSVEQVDQARVGWERFGFQVVAFQSLLFGQPSLTVFEPARREACRRYLEAVVDLAGGMEVPSVVFGSPKNRLRGALSDAEAADVAVPFFQAVARRAEAAGVRFCFEPNPPGYGADFGRTLRESLELIERVDHPAFCLNLDTGALALTGEDPRESVIRARGRIGHVHVSEPLLGSFDAPRAEHRRVSEALQEIGYDGVVSIEMRSQDPGLKVLEEAVGYVRTVYPC